MQEVVPASLDELVVPVRDLVPRGACGGGRGRAGLGWRRRLWGWWGRERGRVATDELPHARRGGALDVDRAAGGGVREADLRRVEGDAPDGVGAGAVAAVAGDRVADPRQVGADLVTPSCFEADAEQRVACPLGLDAVVRDRGARVVGGERRIGVQARARAGLGVEHCDGAAPGVDDVGLDGPPGRGAGCRGREGPLDEGEVLALDTPRAEVLLEPLERALALGEDDDPGDLGVEPVHDPDAGPR